MAKKALPAIEPEETYRVTLTKSIKVGRSFVHPGPNVKLRGNVLAALVADDADAIAGFEPAPLAGE